ncbi:MAG: SLC26A/SulP transporter family protein [Magnetococcales bacterium]|nr:SLC26A/SulP transporter family protein [Magnetococcales bacterium]
MSESRRQDRMGDFWGGLAAMLVALPSAIAYGVAAFTPLGTEYLAAGAMAGVLGTVAIGLLTPALGGAPRLISAPCAPAAAVLAALSTGMMAGTNGLPPVSPSQALLLLSLVALLSGILQLIYGAAGGGKLIKYIPFPVVSGYLSGVGVIIFLSQLPKLLGLAKGTDPWVGVFDPSLWQGPAVLVGLTTIAGMVIAPRITKSLPAPIIGLIAGMSLYFLLGLSRPGLMVLTGNPLLVGPVEVDLKVLGSAAGERWNALGGLHMADVVALIVPAITLSVLLSIDTLKTCVIVDALTRSRHQSNRELLAQGAGNLLSAVVGGMPGAGTMGATLVSLNSGAQTRLSGVLEGVFALAAMLALGTLMGWVPIAALAGILIVVAYRMVDWHSFRLLRQKQTALDFLVIASVVVVAVKINLIAAAGAGVALAVALFLREQVRTPVIRRRVHGGQLSSKRIRLPEQKEMLTANGSLTTICELQGNLFFGTTDQLFTRLEADLRTCRFLILDMRHVHSVDFTAIHLLEQIEAMLMERGAKLVFSDLPPSLPTGRDLRLYLAQTGLVGAAEGIQIFSTLDEALEWAEDRIIEDYDRLMTQEERPLEIHEIDPFKGLREDPGLAALLEGMSERVVEAGETLFHRGDAGDEMYLIRRGRVRVVLPLEGGRIHILAIFGQGNFFGEMAFLDRGKRSTDAVADAPTVLFGLSRRRFEEFSQNNPVTAQKVLGRLARALSIRLRYTNAELMALKES